MSTFKYHPLVQKAKVELEKLDEIKNITWKEESKYKSGILPISVEPKLRSRALKFMDTLIKKLEENNHSIKFEYDRCHIEMYGQLIEIHLRQKFYKKRKSDGSGYEYRKLEKSDKLEFLIGYAYRKSWIDKKTKSLEDYLPAIYNHIEKDSKFWADIKKENKLKKEQREAQKKIEEEIARQKALEKEKLQKLISDSENYNKANSIRNYLTAVETKIQHSKKDEVDQIQNYLEWAHKKANEIDPMFYLNAQYNCS